MRVPAFVCALIAISILSTQAWAGTVTLAPVRFAPEFNERLSSDYGVREGLRLQREIDHALAIALARVGGSVSPSADISIETTLVDARPNRPTFQQVMNRPGLDMMRSISNGGATLTATIRSADGAVLGEVHHHWYSYDLQYAALDTWGDADREFDRFARKVARAYARMAH